MDDFVTVVKSIPGRSWGFGLVGSFITGIGLYGYNVPNDPLFTLIDVNENARALIWIGFLVASPLFVDVARKTLSLQESREE